MTERNEPEDTGTISPAGRGPRWKGRLLWRFGRQAVRRARWDWMIPTAVAAGAGALLDLTDVPIPWLMGPLAAALTLAAMSRRSWTMPPWARAVGQALLGLAVGLSLDLEAIASVGGALVVLSAMVIVTFGLSMLNGFFLWRWSGIERSAGFLGSVPGAASAMVAMSADMGVDPRLVAVIQYLRVLGVAVMVPFMVEHLFPRLPAGWLDAAPVPPEAALLADAASAAPPAFAAADLALIAAFGIVGVFVGRKLRFPSYFFLGPCFVAAAGSYALQFPMPLPPPLLNVSLLLLGTWIGLLFDLPLVRRLGKLTVINLALLAAMLAATIGLAWVFARLTGVGLLTAFLANAPGAMEVIVAASIKLGADTPLVVSVQMLRFLFTLILGPLVARRLAGGSGGAGEEEEAAGSP